MPTLPSHILRIIFLITLHITVTCFTVKAQKLKWNIESPLKVERGLNTISFSLENLDQTDLSGHFEIDLPKGFTILGAATIQASIPGKATRYFTFRAQVNNLSLVSDTKINILLKDKEGKLVSQRALDIKIPRFRKITITDQTPLQTFRLQGDSIHIKLNIQNEGTVEENFKIVLSSPNRYGKTVFKEFSMFLLPGTDSVLVYSFIVERYMTNLSQYLVRVTGINDQDDPFGNVQLAFYNRSSSRDFNANDAMRNNLWQTTGNNLELRVSNIFNQQQNYSMYSTGEYETKTGAIRYGVNMANWQGLDRIFVTNTYLELEHNRHQITAGNLQESLESTFYGRGMKYAFLDTAKGTAVDFGVSDNSNELLSSYQLGSGIPLTAFARLRLGELKKDRKFYDGQVIFNRNTIDTTGFLLWTNSFDISPKKEKSSIVGFVGAGTAFHLVRNDEKYQQNAIALGWKTTQEWNKMRFLMDYFYSTPYYPGNRRGVTQLQHRVSYPLGRWQGAVGYNFHAFTPKSLTYYSSNFKNRQQRLEAQFTGSTRKGNAFITLSPSYNTENASYSFSNIPFELSSKSYLLQTNGQYFSANRKHNINILAEGGYINVNNPNQTDNNSSGETALRMDATYGYGQIRFMGGFQKGTFQLYELFNSILYNTSLSTQYSFGVQASGAFLGDKVKWNLNNTGRYSKLWGFNVLNVGSIDYQLKKTTRISMQGQFTYTKGLSNNPYTYNNVQMVVKQQLPSGKIINKKPQGNVKMFIFYDNNYNGVYDQGDAVASNYNLMFGSVSFSTNNKGQAVYKNIPFGDYVIFTPPINNYSAKSKVVNVDSKSVNVQVALQQVSTLNGEIILEYNPAFDLTVNTNLSGYRVLAEASDGVIYTAETDETGKFILQVPRGKYIISLDKNSFAENVLTEEKSIEVELQIGEKLKTRPFILKAKKKNIEIKRFGS